MPRLGRDCHRKLGCTTRVIQTFVQFYCCLGGLLVKTRPRFDTQLLFQIYTSRVRRNKVHWASEPGELVTAEQTV